MMASELFSVYYGAALVLFAASVLGFRKARPRAAEASSATPYIAFLVASYVLQLAIVRYGATHQTPWQTWRSLLPIPVFERDARNEEVLSAFMVSLAFAQSLCLLAIYRRRASRAVVAAAASIVILLSLSEPAFISPDAYSYVADVMLGTAAYAPTAVPLGGEYRVINDALGLPLSASPYGPLWIEITAVVTGAAPSLLAKLLALRVFGVLMLIAFLAALNALRLPSRIITVAALNPALALQYVANAHNDLFCIACVAWAAVIARRMPLVSMAAVVAAALVKLPFAAFGLPAFFGVVSPRLRWLYVGGAVVCAITLSWLLAGAAYFRAVLSHVPAHTPAGALGFAVSICALAAVISAVVRRRRFETAAWLFPLAGSYATPWYVAWGSGYAIASRRALGYLLVFLPIASTLVDTAFMQLWTLILVPFLTIFALAQQIRVSVTAGDRSLVLK